MSDAKQLVVGHGEGAPGVPEPFTGRYPFVFTSAAERAILAELAGIRARLDQILAALGERGGKQ